MERDFSRIAWALFLAKLMLITKLFLLIMGLPTIRFFTRENFPEVKLVALRENTGFTGGNAAGLEVAVGDFVSLVNNDARPEKTWLENLIQLMLGDRTIGICASKIIFENPQILNSAGDGLTTAGVGFNRGLGQNTAQFDTPEPVFGACGAAVLYRRRMLDEIGFLGRGFLSL